MESLDKLAARAADPKLHLVLIGEFSTGKSTLINALLGAELLSYSALPTTRAVTELRDAPRPALCVRFADRSRALSWEALEPIQQSALFREVSSLVTLAPTLADLIRALTTDEGLAPLVTSIVLEHPMADLGRDLVLYDTPGTNDDEHLTGITHDLVNRVADGVVVVLRADMPVSMETGALIGRLTSAVPADCMVFVVTHLDVVEEDQRERVLRAINQRLHASVPSAHVVLHPLTPHVVVRRQRGAELTEEQGRWADAFDHNLAQLRLDIERRRLAIGSQRLVELITQLLGQMDEDLRNDLAVLDDRRSAVAHALGSDMAGVRTNICRTFAIRVGEMRNDFQLTVQRDLAERVDQLRVRATALITGAGTPAALDRVVTDELPTLTSDFTADVQALLGAATTDRAALLARSGSALLRTLVERYNELASVTGAEPKALDAMVVEAPAPIAIDLEAIHRTVRIMVGERAGLKSNGTKIGAVLGTLVAPGIGTALGAGLGRLTGSLLGPSIIAIRASTLEALEECVRELSVERLPSLVDGVATELGAAAIEATEAASAEIYAAYVSLVQTTRATQHSELTQLDARQADLNLLRREADEQIQRLAQLRVNTAVS
ncbi:MAG: dynamin family protein [Acidimicrobiia bacterium]